jgi:sugar lactone lactonase YvrE
MRFLIVLTVVCLAATLLSVSVSASLVLAFDRSGNLFFEGRNTGTIFKYAPDGTRTTFASASKDTAINGDLAVDSKGNVFAYANSTTILRFAPDGTRSTFATGVGTYWPSALAVDKTGNLFVGARGMILKFAPDGTRSVFATGVEAYGLAFDQAGNLFASDSHGENGHLVSAIVKFTPDGTKSTFANTHGYGLAFDKSGNLFVSGGEEVLKFTPDGTKSTFAKADVSEGLAFDAAGNLIGCDGNNRIFKLTPDGTKTAFSAKRPEPGTADENGEDTSTGLPARYANDYLVASSTTSPDKRFAVIYPKFSEEVADTANTSKIKNYLVALQPFVILRALETKWPYFQNESHGGLRANWSDDSSVALITLDGKWGPHDIFLVEFRDGKLKQMINILAKAHDLLLPDYRKAKAARYNEYFDFIFESEDNPICKLDGPEHVRINALATTDPKGGGDERVWEGRLKATWDVAQAKFTSQKVTRVFAGVRKHED